VGIIKGPIWNFQSESVCCESQESVSISLRKMVESNHNTNEIQPNLTDSAVERSRAQQEHSQVYMSIITGCRKAREAPLSGAGNRIVSDVRYIEDH
jgi:hypothetical protein